MQLKPTPHYKLSEDQKKQLETRNKLYEAFFYEQAILAWAWNRRSKHFAYDNRYKIFDYPIDKIRELKIQQDVDEVISITKWTIAQMNKDWVTAGFCYDETQSPYDFTPLEKYPDHYRFGDVQSAIQSITNLSLDTSALSSTPKRKLPDLIRMHNITRAEMQETKTELQEIQQSFTHKYETCLQTMIQNQEILVGQEMSQDDKNEIEKLIAHYKNNILYFSFYFDNSQTLFFRPNSLENLSQYNTAINEQEMSWMLHFIAAYYNVYFPHEQFTELTSFQSLPMYVKYGITSNPCKSVIIPPELFEWATQLLISNRPINNQQNDHNLDRVDCIGHWLYQIATQYDQILFPIYEAQVAESGTGHWILVRLLKREKNSFAVSILDPLSTQVTSWDEFLQFKSIDSRVRVAKFLIESMILNNYNYSFCVQSNVPLQGNDDCGINTTLNIAALCYAGKKQNLAKEDFAFNQQTVKQTRDFFVWHYSLMQFNAIDYNQMQGIENYALNLY